MNVWTYSYMNYYFDQRFSRFRGWTIWWKKLVILCVFIFCLIEVWMIHRSRRSIFYRTYVKSRATISQNITTLHYIECKNTYECFACKVFILITLHIVSHFIVFIARAKFAILQKRDILNVGWTRFYQYRNLKSDV